MRVVYNSAKNGINIEQRGLSFERASELDMSTALIVVDDRHDYNEIRYRAIGLLGGREHVLVFVEADDGIRVISFRKANKREVLIYERYIQST